MDEPNLLLPPDDLDLVDRPKMAALVPKILLGGGLGEVTDKDVACGVVFTDMM